jgi:hypothetical protein
MNNEQKCRYCGEAFIPNAGKAGRIDECGPCLDERTRHKNRTYFGEERRDLLDLARTMVEADERGNMPLAEREAEIRRLADYLEAGTVRPKRKHLE